MMISFKIFGTLVRVKAVVWLLVVVVWGVVTWLGCHWHPERSLGQGLLIGFVTTILLMVVDFGHAFAHIFSARYAGAPLDEILLSADMPRTLYWNNEVAPKVHRMRALGGPLFNLVCLALSAAVYGVVAGHAIARELAGWSAIGHGLLLIMSLLPLPPVDGGTILKWTLVERGRPARSADEIVRRVDWGMGLVAGIIGLGLLALRLWLAGVIIAGISVIVIGIAAGKIR